MGIRTLHQGVQKALARQDDHFLFLSQQEKRFLQH
jgi:hypothetical protein